MLPLFGPSTFRDTVALPLDMAGDIWRYKEPIYLRNIGTGTRLIDKRAALLDASNLLEGAALDRYEFVRDGFLQQRESRVFDGESAPKSKPEPKTSEVDAGAVVPLAVMPDTMEISLPVSSDAAVQELTTDTDAAHSASL